MLSKFKQSTLLVGTLFGIVCFQISLAFQGFDLCDEGFTLTFFQQIFNDPQSVEYNFLFWLSGVVGGIWQKIFPNAGILSFRILGILMHLLGLVLVILIFRKRLPDWILALSCIVLTLIPSYGVILFAHNHLVVVLSLAAFYFLIRGIEQNRWWMLFLSGFLLALNTFSRLPSLTLLVWILLIPLFSADWKKSLKQIGLVCAGLIDGFIVVFLTMLIFGHIEIFTDSVRMMFSIAGLAENSHSFEQLLGTFFWNYKTIAKLSIVLIGFAGLWFSVLRFFKNRHWINYLICAISVVAFVFIMRGTHIIYWLYALCFLSLGLWFWKTNDQNLRRLILGSVMIMIFLPVGSDFYIGNMGAHSIWLAIPLTLGFGFSSSKFSPVFDQSRQWFFIAFLSAFCVLQLYRISNQAYFDKGSRFEKRYAIHHSTAKHIFTTKHRADIMNQFIPVLNRYISPDDYVLAFEHIPMIHAMTRSKPFAYTPWLLTYCGAMFEQQLLRAEKERALPIVVAQHFESFPDWSAPQNNYYAENKPNTFKHDSKRTSVFNEFLKRHDYEKVWTNGYFSIWKPGTP